MRRFAVLCLLLLCWWASPSVAAEGQRAAGPDAQVADLCKRLGKIRLMPFYDEHIDDKVYNQVKAKGMAIVPCLIDQLTNESKTPDPRPVPRISDFRVGDLAFFLLLQITHVAPEQVLPKEIWDAWPKEGVYAYFRYTHEDHANRVELQRRWRAWLAAQTPKRQLSACGPG